MSEGGENAIAFSVCIVLLVGTCAGAGYCYPKWRLYNNEMRGEASLKEATWDRQIAVEEAQAKNEAASLLAAAEVARARGVAEANTIIGDSLQGNEAYLRYLFIDTLSDKDVIYLPTEAGLPILEARPR